MFCPEKRWAAKGELPLCATRVSEARPGAPPRNAAVAHLSPSTEQDLCFPPAPHAAHRGGKAPAMPFLQAAGHHTGTQPASGSTGKRKILCGVACHPESDLCRFYTGPLFFVIWFLWFSSYNGFYIKEFSCPSENCLSSDGRRPVALFWCRFKNFFSWT